MLNTFLQIRFTELVEGNKTDRLELNLIVKKQQSRNYLGIFCTVWNEEMNWWV